MTFVAKREGEDIVPANCVKRDVVMNRRFVSVLCRLNCFNYFLSQLQLAHPAQNQEGQNCTCAVLEKRAPSLWLGISQETWIKL